MILVLVMAMGAVLGGFLGLLIIPEEEGEA